MANNFLLSLVLLYLHMHLIPHDLGCRATGRRNIFLCGVLCDFFPLLPHPSPLFISVTAASLLRSMGFMAGLSGFASHRHSLHIRS